MLISLTEPKFLNSKASETEADEKNLQKMLKYKDLITLFPNYCANYDGKKVNLILQICAQCIYPGQLYDSNLR